MRRFSCPQCGNQVHFDNLNCLNCNAQLGYIPAQSAMMNMHGTQAACANRDLIGCNWAVETPGALCLSCRHTIKIPHLADLERRALLAKLETAKRRLFYALIRFDLPLDWGTATSESGLRFALLADELKVDGADNHVMTGHSNGLITINIAEADDVTREKNRAAMGEPYRTLIGHFRHEVAHYYWDRLIAGQSSIKDFRARFGDERQDYSDALKQYYDQGAPANWQQNFVSEYASAHPWEDFAETWAHYFHIVDGLETAGAYGIHPQTMHIGAPRLAPISDPYVAADAKQLIDQWVPLTIAMNAMSRSMGNNDYYPFVLTDQIMQKLAFVHDLIAPGRTRN